MLLHACWTLSHVFSCGSSHSGLNFGPLFFMKHHHLDQVKPWVHKFQYFIALLCDMLGFTQLAQRNKLGNAFLK